MTVSVRWFTNPTEYRTHLTESRGAHSLLKAEPIKMSDFGYIFHGRPGCLMYPVLFWSSDTKPEKSVVAPLVAEYAKRYDFRKK